MYINKNYYYSFINQDKINQENTKDMIKITKDNFQKLPINEIRNFDKYEIIPDFKLTDNKIIDQCFHVRKKESGSTLYFGGLTFADCYSFQSFVNKSYNTSTLFVDGYRAVFSDNDNYNIYTYCEGDISVEVFETEEQYRKGIESVIEFYKTN